MFSLRPCLPSPTPGRLRSERTDPVKERSLEDSANLPDPDVIAAEIAEDVQAATCYGTAESPSDAPSAPTCAVTIT
jgi:hypothetical protein